MLTLFTKKDLKENDLSFRMTEGGILNDVLDRVVGDISEVETVVECLVYPTTSGGVYDTKYTTCFATQRLKLPAFATDIRANKVKCWELVKVETRPLGANNYPGLATPSVNFWSVSGQPLNMCQTDASKPIHTQTVKPLLNGQDFDFALWTPSLFHNNNAKWTFKHVGGIPYPGIPYATYDGNSSTTIISDENGWGILCRSGYLYLAQLDIANQPQKPDQGNPSWSPMCREFRLHFVQRWLSNKTVVRALWMAQAETQDDKAYAGGEVTVDNSAFVDPDYNGPTEA